MEGTVTISLKDYEKLTTKTIIENAKADAQIKAVSDFLRKLSHRDPVLEREIQFFLQTLN